MDFKKEVSEIREMVIKLSTTTKDEPRIKLKRQIANKKRALEAEGYTVLTNIQSLDAALE